MKRVKKIVHYKSEWLGKGIVVVVMDTGVSKHPSLDGRIIRFRDFVNGQYEGKGTLYQQSKKKETISYE